VRPVIEKASLGFLFHNYLWKQVMARMWLATADLPLVSGQLVSRGYPSPYYYDASNACNLCISGGKLLQRWHVSWLSLLQSTWKVWCQRWRRILHVVTQKGIKEMQRGSLYFKCTFTTEKWQQQGSCMQALRYACISMSLQFFWRATHWHRFVILLVHIRGDRLEPTAFKSLG